MPDPGRPEEPPPGEASTTDADTIAALRSEVARLKAEAARLAEELRRARRDHHETPPHYL